jgi:hypothetical protein
MKAGIGITLALALVLTLVFASVAFATSQATIDKIIKDASDGMIDGTYSAADVQAALDFVSANPTYSQYGQVEGVLSDYLASLQSPEATSAGELKFTGGELFMVFAAGAGLIGSGAVLRRRRS